MHLRCLLLTVGLQASWRLPVSICKIAQLCSEMACQLMFKKAHRYVTDVEATLGVDLKDPVGRSQRRLLIR